MTLELVETARFCVYARRDARERWFGRSVARFTERAENPDWSDRALVALIDALAASAL